MRIAILGNSGSGKSTLARHLAAAHGLSMLDLDTVAWEPGQIAVPRDPAAAVAEVRAFCGSQERWVVEGCYAGLVEAALEFSPLLVFLEPGVEVCSANCRERPWEPHKYRTKAEQDERLAFLLAWVEEYYSREGELSLKAHQALFETYSGPKRKFTDRVDPDEIPLPRS
jgi:adenylate kinase family enzyme